LENVHSYHGLKLGRSRLSGRVCFGLGEAQQRPTLKRERHRERERERKKEREREREREKEKERERKRSSVVMDWVRIFESEFLLSISRDYLTFPV
jgi:hypothetical protein